MFKKIITFILIFNFFIFQFLLAWKKDSGELNQFDSNFFEGTQTKNLGEDSFFSSPFFDTWLVYTSFNFEIHYYNYEKAKNLIQTIDSAYSKIIEDLSAVSYYSPSHRVKIYIYRTKEDYEKSTSGGHWSGGYSNMKTNAIYTFEQEDLMRDVILHELTHIVFDSFMGWPRNLSISWLHEGIAVYMEKKFFNKKWDLKYLKEKDKEGKLYSLKDGFKTETGFEQDTNKISLWYLEMGSVIYYLFSLKKEGFKVFCDNIKIYKNIEEALKRTYPWEFHSVEDLDREWRKWIYQQGDYI